MSQFILYLERVQESRNYYNESNKTSTSEEEYLKRYKKRGDNWYDNQGLKLNDPKFKTPGDRFKAGGIRDALLEPARSAKQWDGKITLTEKDKRTLKNIFIKTPIAALISLGLILAQILPPEIQETQINNIKYEALQQIYSNNDNINKDEAIKIINSTIEKAKSGELNDNDLKDLNKINPDASKQLEEVKKSYPTLIERIKGFFQNN
jgi:hypothetical protein